MVSGVPQAVRPFFSIIIPCCDVEPYLRECLDSVVKQPFADWECILGVEASKDKTEEIVREYVAKDPRFRMFTGPRSGSCSASRNTGTDMAEGEYVIFLDGDDTIAEGSLLRLHDKIAERPGADLYPCAIRMYDGTTGKDLELRDNYPANATQSLTGPEATLLSARHHKGVGPPCPMLQMTVFRRAFLVQYGLKCIPGLRRQDSEFSPRALYLAKQVVPLHEPFYLYRCRAGSVSSSARGGGYFHRDWAIILRSLFEFHAAASREDGFDSRLSGCWARQWLSLVAYFWFAPENVRLIPRTRRVETLREMFSNGFDDFRRLLSASTAARRVAGWWIRAFVRHPAMRPAAEWFFRLYFRLAEAKRKNTTCSSLA